MSQMLSPTTKGPIKQATCVTSPFTIPIVNIYPPLLKLSSVTDIKHEEDKMKNQRQSSHTTEV
jgi:hypothetical protein